MLFHIEDEEQVFWCLVNLMERYAWRWLYVDGLPKLQHLIAKMRQSLTDEFPRVRQHFYEHNIQLESVFSAHLMTVFVYRSSVDSAARLFDVFLLDGHETPIKILLKMVELQQKKILSLTEDVELQKYLLGGIVDECLSHYGIAKLTE